MKQLLKAVAAFIFFILVRLSVYAQDNKLTIDKAEVGSWFQRNWMWVSGAFILLLIIVFASSGRRGRRRSTTTMVKDAQGNVKTISTTEVSE